MIGLDIYDARVIPDKLTEDAIYKLRRFYWSPAISIVGRRCFLSGNTIPWFSQAYKGIKIISGPGEDVVITKWATPEAVVFQKLKGIIK